MVATVTVVEMTGSGPTYNTVTEIRFCTADNHNPGMDNPLIIPKAPITFYWSYWKHLGLNFAGSFTQIDNVNIYTDGACPWTYGTGGGVFIGQRDAGDHGCPVANYEQSSGTEGESGHEIKDGDDGHDYYKGQTAAVEDLFSFTSGSPCTIDSTTHTTPEKSKMAVIQEKIAPDATQGVQSDETLTFVHDEI